MGEETQQEEAAARRRGFRAGRVKNTTGNAPGAGAPAPAKRQKQSVFGPSVEARPDILTDAETVLLPKLTAAATRLLRPDLPIRQDTDTPAVPSATAPGSPATAAGSPAEALVEIPEAAQDAPDISEDAPEFLERAIKAAEEFLASLDAPDRDKAEIAESDERDPDESAAVAEEAPNPVTAADLPAVEVLPADATVDEAIIDEAIVVIEADATAGKPSAEKTIAREPVEEKTLAAESIDEKTLILEPSAAEALATLAPLGRDRHRWLPGGRGTVREFEYPYVAPRRRTSLSRLVLLAILCLQAVLTLRLRNTAFEDEALYLYAGHMEVEHLLHGAALQGSYAAYFSGAPVLYPVAAAVLNHFGGLALARGLSLAEMLATTALLYSLTRRLFNERAALLAAAMFAVAEGVSFIGNLATYDATCLFLLAVGAWIMVRTAGHRWPLFLLAAPVVSLAVAVKYAGAMFIPTIAVLVALAGWPALGRRVVLRPVLFGIAVAAILYGGLRLGGPLYHLALSSTTTSRAHGTTPVSTLIQETLRWGGLVIVLAIIGTIGYTRRVRIEPDEGMAQAGGRFRRLALGLVLTGTAFLAPVYQAHLHTDVSFQKHIGFGLFFAAPIAGLGLARVIGDHFRRPQIGIAFWCAALVLGMVQSQGLYHVWPDSTKFTSAFSRYLQPKARYLVEVPEVPIYYLEGRSGAQPHQFTSTFNITYVNKKHQAISGSPGYRAAIAAGYFRAVAYNNLTTPSTDQVIAQALKASGKYYLATAVQVKESGYPVTFTIWVKGHAPAKHKTTKHKTTKHKTAKNAAAKNTTATSKPVKK